MAKKKNTRKLCHQLSEEIDVSSEIMACDPWILNCSMPVVVQVVCCVDTAKF